LMVEGKDKALIEKIPGDSQTQNISAGPIE